MALQLPQKLAAHKQLITTYTAAAVIIVLSFLSGCWYASPLRDRAAHKQAVTLTVTFAFDDHASMDAWREAWTPFADYVRRRERSTLTYELFAAMDNPLQLMVFERYVNARALNVTHRKSDAINEYRSKVRGLNYTMTKVQFVQQDLGFI